MEIPASKKRKRLIGYIVLVVIIIIGIIVVLNAVSEANSSLFNEISVNL